MSLSDAAKALGLPEPLVKRSAEARAAETGVSVEEILAAWASGAAPSATAQQATEEPAAEPAEEPAEEPAAETVAEEPSPSEEKVEAPPATPPPTRPPETTPTRAPIPAEVTAAEAARLPEVVTVPTAGIRERTNFVIPKWLTAVLVAVPLIALFALGGSATGECGEATELRVDVITGKIVNCDGSEFTGGGAGGGGTDFVALGEQVYAGGAVAGVNCAGCHGAGGQGSATFPPLTGVITTFGACADHIEWVTLGSDGWLSQYGDTYGDTNKRVNRGMPAFGATLSEEQLAAVVAFERVRFGGAAPEEVLEDCGLVEGEDGEAGEEVPPGEGETPTTGGGETTTTEAGG